MDSNERVIQALHEFENMTDADKVLTQELEDLFIQIAHTGRIQIPWIYLKPVFMFKLDKVMRDFFESSPSRNSTSSEPTHTAEFDVMRQRLLDCIESFTGAPFTVQRLCELMIEPKRHYRSSDKFMRGVEKNILVVSTMTDIEGQESTNSHENNTIPNGPVTNGIITTESATEMSSISDECCESNVQHPEHYHDAHYPTANELPHINGGSTIENTNGVTIDTIQPTQTEDKLSETQPEERSDAEKTPSVESEEKPADDSDNSESLDSSDSFSEETSEEQQSTETSEQEEKNTEGKEKSIEEKENVEDKETVKHDSQEQKDTKCEERIESKLEQEEKEEEPSTEEPMEE